MKAPWVTYRPELKVLDCTIRDGGLVNDHHFDDELVKAVYATCIEAGVDYMEIGYRNSRRLFPPERYGPFRRSSEEDIRRVIGDHDGEATGLKLAVMADAGKSDWKTDIIPADQSVVSMIRVACYVNQVPEAVEMIQHAHELGYETTFNLMAVSTAQEPEIDQALETVAQTPVGTIIVVDSYGSLYREQLDWLIPKYLDAVAGSGKTVGIHAHNNQQLAFANTIEAIILGANLTDASMAGLGRGAGNCPMELLLGFLRNPKFKLRPVCELLEAYFVDLRKEIEWGPLVPYNLTGLQNCHPREAIELRAGPNKDRYAAFYDRIVGDA